MWNTFWFIFFNHWIRAQPAESKLQQMFSVSEKSTYTSSTVLSLHTAFDLQKDRFRAEYHLKAEIHNFARFQTTAEVMECLVLFVWPLRTHSSTAASIAHEKTSRRAVCGKGSALSSPLTQRAKPYDLKYHRTNHHKTNSDVRYICQRCRNSGQVIHTAAQCPSSPCLSLSLQQMDCEGVKPPEPSTLPTVLAPTRYQIYTPIHNAAPTQFAPSASKSQAGEQRQWHHATKCHLAPSLVAMLSPLAAPGGLVCLRPYLRPHWCHVEGAGRRWHWLGFGTGHCLFNTTSRSLSLPGGNALKSVFVWFVWVCRADRQTDRQTVKLAFFPLPPWIRDSYLWAVSLCTRLFADSCAECHLPEEHSIRKEGNRKLDTQETRWTDQTRGLAEWKALCNLAEPCLRSCQCRPTRKRPTLLLPSGAARNIRRVLAKKIIRKTVCPLLWVIAILMSRSKKK